jgi:hypothetical protein
MSKRQSKSFQTPDHIPRILPVFDHPCPRSEVLKVLWHTDREQNDREQDILPLPSNFINEYNPTSESFFLILLLPTITILIYLTMTPSFNL